MLITQKHSHHKLVMEPPLDTELKRWLCFLQTHLFGRETKHGEFILHLHNIFVCRKEHWNGKCFSHSECGVTPPWRCRTVSNSFPHYVILLSRTTRGFFKMYSTSNLFLRREILIEHAHHLTYFTSLLSLFALIIGPSVACLSKGIKRTEHSSTMSCWGLFN